MPAVVGVLRVIVTGPFPASVGWPGDGHPLGFVGQPAGTGPIVVDVDKIVPSSGLEYVWAWTVSVEFTAGCDVPPQTRLKFTDRVTVWPGPMTPRSIVAWLPGSVKSPSAGTVSAKTAVAEIRNATTASAAARRITLLSIVRASPSLVKKAE